MRLEQTVTPDREDIDFLTAKINEEFSSYGEASPFALFLRNDEGEIIAGCNGSIIFGVIYTDQFWVSPEIRKQGVARVLMDLVHEYGREKGCQLATVATMDFQGLQAFYEHFGYEVDFERPGYVQNSHCVFMKKSL